MRRLLRLWFSFVDPVDRKTYAVHGLGLMAFKYALDAALLGFSTPVAIATTGAIYITDTGIRFDDVGNVLHPGPDRVFRIGPDRKVTVAARGDSLGWPNGITVAPAAGWRLVGGTILFSGSLYLLSLTGIRWLGAVTPDGGVLFLAGWLALAYGMWRS